MRERASSKLPPVLVYDGTCGFCAESVRLVLKHDRTRIVRFAARDSEFGRGVLRRHPELAGVDSMLWVESRGGDPTREVVLARSAAALRAAGYLGGWWRLAVVARLVPRILRDAAYGIVARHRHRLSGNRPVCVIPPAADRDRFL